jgi:nucleoid DNA-binding protein
VPYDVVVRTVVQELSPYRPTTIRQSDLLVSLIANGGVRRRVLRRLFRMLAEAVSPSASELDALRTVADLVAAIKKRPNRQVALSLRAKKAAKKVAKKAPKKVLTVPLSKVAADLAKKTGRTKKDATGALEDFIGLLVKHPKTRNKVRITDLGILQVRNRPARMGRNPATGEAIKIKASKKVALRVKDFEAPIEPPKRKPTKKKATARRPVARKAAKKKGGGGEMRVRKPAAPPSGRPRRQRTTPPAGPPPRRTRYANAALYAVDGRRLEQTTPLDSGKVVRLTLDIGELSADSDVSGAAPLPATLPDKIFIEVMVSSTDFGVGRDAKATAGTLAHGVFFLSDEAEAAQAVNGREGKYLDFHLRVPTPEGNAPAHARIGYYYRNILLQSQLLTARFGAVDTGFTIETDFTTSEDFTGLAVLPIKPRVSVLTNANDDGSHQIVLRHPGVEKDPDAVAETIAIDADGIGGTIAQLRKVLADCADRAPDANPRPKNDLAADLMALAPLGWQLYAQLPGQLKADFLGSWRETPDKFVLQIARPSSSRFTAPWNYIYDIPLEKGANYTLCRSISDWDGKRALFDGAPRQCLHGPHDANVLCPFGFWGYRYAIEQVVRRKDTDSIVTIKVAAGGDVVAAQAQYDVDLRVLGEHIGRMKAMALAAPLKANLKEGKTKADIQTLLGADLPFVYFYCHGERPRYGSPDTYLGVGNREAIPAEDFIGWTRLWYKRLRRVIWSTLRPLVFINACHSVAVETATLVSFVDAFVTTGQAAGVIGTEVKVPQKMAMAAGETFAGAWLSGKSTVEEALRTVRIKYLEQGNLLGLAYTPYCWSELKLTVV